MVRLETERPSVTPARATALPKLAAAPVVAGWACLCGGLLLLQRARPQSFAYDRFFGVHSRRRIWDEVGVERALWWIVAALVLSALALLLSRRRAVPSALPAELPWSALVLAVGALAAFLGHLFYFG